MSVIVITGGTSLLGEYFPQRNLKRGSGTGTMATFGSVERAAIHEGSSAMQQWYVVNAMWPDHCAFLTYRAERKVLSGYVELG